MLRTCWTPCRGLYRYNLLELWGRYHYYSHSTAEEAEAPKTLISRPRPPRSEWWERPKQLQCAHIRDSDVLWWWCWWCWWVGLFLSPTFPSPLSLLPLMNDTSPWPRLHSLWYSKHPSSRASVFIDFRHTLLLVNGCVHQPGSSPSSYFRDFYRGFIT